MKTIFLVLYYAVAVHLPSRSFSSFGVRLRRFLVERIFLSAGTNVNIAKGVRFGRGDKVSIGCNSGIGERGFLVAMAPIDIGSNVMIGPEVMMLTGGHDFSDPNKLLVDQLIVSKPISISDDVWIGARAVILPGANIEGRVIVAAGAVVSGTLKSGYIYAGIPARPVKQIPPN